MGLTTKTFGYLRAGIGHEASAREIESKLGGVGVFGAGVATDLFVSSVLGSDTGSFDGLSSGQPLATVKEALTKTTASRGDRIFLMPGHVESIGSTPLAWNVVGVSIIGLGSGASRPRFDYDNAASSIDISANDVLVSNITLRPSVTDVLVGVDVVAAVLNTVLHGIEALPGEDGAGVDDFALVVDIKAGCTNTQVLGLKVRQHASGAGYIAGIRLTGASDDCLFAGCDIDILGAGVIAPINGITTLSTKLRIENCTLVTDAEPGIELLTGTTGVIKEVDIFADLATIDAATVADGMAHFDVQYVEVGNESGAVVKTASADD